MFTSSSSDYHHQEARLTEKLIGRTRRRTRLQTTTLHRPSLFLVLLSLATTIITGSIASSEPPLSSPPTHSSSSPAIQAQSTSLPRPKLNQNFSDLSPAHYRCLPISPCQPCPIDQIHPHQHNLIITVEFARPTFFSSSTHPNQDGKAIDIPQFQTWQACERIVSKERQDFYEFFLCNVAIALISLVVYGFRTKQLVIKQYGKLAARIGILPS
ncbi:hypothetical protein PSTT_01667 [Puccinia striiformis]|uniref:Uncharacterized protein n=1 Tax=Puccinia striiformis TaxID=27350 RepID=A0A2S4W2X0_9BASI|nr:hypothetical protein PSTT_01667 [Puccinia striiformis]